MRFPVPQPVLDALRKLNQSGHEAYLVGGCVRDDFLGIQPRDYDVCTSALPLEVKACFVGERMGETGLRHGTVTVFLEGMAIEFTTYRVDGAYSDSRRPDTVTFTRSLYEDLRRRDFTINALAWHPDTGTVDPFKGIEDLRRKRIATVGAPADRFSEDALRMLRALRFSAQLGFTVDGKALDAMNALSGRLRHVSAERVASELNLLLGGLHAGKALGLSPGTVFEVLPELEPLHRCPSLPAAAGLGTWAPGLWELTLRTLAAVPRTLDLRWAALLRHCGKPDAFRLGAEGTLYLTAYRERSFQLAERCLKRLRQPRSLTDAVLALLAHCGSRVGADNVRLWLSRLGFPALSGLLALDKAACNSMPEGSVMAQAFDRMLNRAQRLSESGCCLSLKELAVDGSILMKHGFSPGRFLGETLRYLLALVLSGQAENRTEVLLPFALDRLRGTDRPRRQSQQGLGP